jgi:hypothetical protein
MSEQTIIDKQNRNLEIRDEIKVLKEQIYMLKQEQKINDVFIFSNCVHNWVKDRNYFQYDERPNRCTKCNMVRN